MGADEYCQWLLYVLNWCQNNNSSSTCPFSTGILRTSLIFLLRQIWSVYFELYCSWKCSGTALLAARTRICNCVRYIYNLCISRFCASDSGILLFVWEEYTDVAAFCYSFFSYYFFCSLLPVLNGRYNPFGSCTYSPNFPFYQFLAEFFFLF